jgi:hypothetical protein
MLMQQNTIKGDKEVDMILLPVEIELFFEKRNYVFERKYLNNCKALFGCFS